MRIVVTVALLLVCAYLEAQERWSLSRCIEYAVEHNIEVKQQQNNVSANEIALQNRKLTYLPQVGASVGQSFNFGRGLTQDNTYANRNTRNTSFDIGAQVTLFQYGRRREKEAQALNLQSAEAELGSVKDGISINVASAYLQAVYRGQLLEVARKQEDYLRQVKEQKQSLLDYGRGTEIEVAEAQSNLARAQLDVVKAESSYKESLLELSQLLELPDVEGFDINYDIEEVDGVKIPEVMEVYSRALESRNDIRAAELRLKRAELTIDAAKAGHVPTLSMSAGLGSNYYKVNGFNNESFGTQLERNFNEYLSFNLQIPVFSKLQTSNSIKQARLEMQQTDLQLQLVKKNLYKGIQVAHINALNAQNAYRQSKATLEATTKAMEQMRQKMDEGRATQTQYMQYMAQWVQSLADHAYAQTDLLFRVKILDFYRGTGL